MDRTPDLGYWFGRLSLQPSRINYPPSAINYPPSAISQQREPMRETTGARIPKRSWLSLLQILALLSGPPLAAALAARADDAAKPARAPAPGLAADANPTAAIDTLVARRWQGLKLAPASLCDDRAFARRLYLDLAGRIPTPAEVDAFAADTSTGKRAALVDRLLASPEYARHLRDVFDVVLIGRGEAQPRRRRFDAGPSDGRSQWLAYLERSFAENRPWDRLVKDLLIARPTAEADQGAVWFLYSRQNQYQATAEAVSP